MRVGWYRILLLFLSAACVQPSLPREDAHKLSERNQEQASTFGGRGSWHVLPDGPLSARAGHVAVWTGREMIVWGGQTESKRPLEWRPARDGAAYDPQLDSWRRIASAPIPGGTRYSAIWSGTEMLVWGDGGREGDVAVGAAYDPAADAWRVLAPGPLPPRAGHLTLWTGHEMLLWGGWLTAAKRERYDGRGAAYDPAADSWRTLPPAPLPAGFDAMGAWTGAEAIVMATSLGDPAGRPTQARAATYDPTTDEWRRLPRPPMAAWVSPPAVLLDGRLFLLSTGGTVDGGGEYAPYPTGGVYEVAGERWIGHAPAPRVPTRQSWPQMGLGREIVLNDLAYDPASNSWRRLPKFPFGYQEYPARVWTGQELIVWGGTEPWGETGRLVDTGAAYRPPA